MGEDFLNHILNVSMISEVEPQSWISRVTDYRKIAKDLKFEVGQHVLKTHPKTKDLIRLIELNKSGENHGFKFMKRDEMENLFETDESGKTSARNTKRVMEASDETSSRTQKRVRRTTDGTHKDVMETPARTRKIPVVVLTNCLSTNVPAVTQKSGEAPKPRSQQKSKPKWKSSTVRPHETYQQKQKRLQARSSRIAVKQNNDEITTDKNQPHKAAKKSTTKSQPPKPAKRQPTKSQPPQEDSPVVFAIKSKVFNVAVDGASKSDEEEENVTVEEEEDVTDEPQVVNAADDEEEEVAVEMEAEDEEEDEEEEDVADEEEEEASQVVNAVSNVEMDGTRNAKKNAEKNDNTQLITGSREEGSDGDGSIVETIQMTSEPSEELSFGKPLEFENSALMETVIDDVLLFHSLAVQ